MWPPAPDSADNGRNAPRLNVLLTAVAFAPSLNAALTLLFARFALADGRTNPPGLRRQRRRPRRTDKGGGAHECRALPDPPGRAADRALLASVALSAPFAVAGAVKSAYDLLLFAVSPRGSRATRRRPCRSRHESSGGSAPVSWGVGTSTRRRVEDNAYGSAARNSLRC
jgi:hypothetical protein